jgi:hypothetical protein
VDGDQGVEDDDVGGVLHHVVHQANEADLECLDIENYEIVHLECSDIEKINLYH